jgi:hypothetical protein
MPPDLVRALKVHGGLDLVQLLGASMRNGLPGLPAGLTGDAWWTVGLPAFTSQLVRDKRLTEKYHAEDLAISVEQTATEHGERMATEDELEAALAEIEDLRGKVREAKGREDALQGVMQLHMSG